MVVSEEYLTFKEIAGRFKVTVQAVSSWVTRGVQVVGVPQRLLAFRAGALWRVREEDLQDFLRRINPDTWSQLALKQDRERRQAQKDCSRLQRKLKGVRSGRRRSTVQQA